MAPNSPGPTKFGARNVMPGCTIVDAEAKKTIRRVTSIDLDKGQVVVHREPLTIGPNGNIQQYALKYRSIYPIYGGYRRPCLFHCYGRL